MVKRRKFSLLVLFSVLFGMLCFCPPGNGAAPFKRGDASGNSELDVSDVIQSLEFLFLGTGELGCEDAADTNDDGFLNIADPIASLTFLFIGGYTIPVPGPETCGGDPTNDTLGCEEYTGCAGLPFYELVTITSPSRGAMLTSSPNIQVQGTVKDPRVVAVTVNDNPVTIDKSGRFTHIMTARHGINLIRTTAIDFSGNEAKGVRSFLWSARYKAGSTSPAVARIPDGIVASLDQDVFDDGNRAEAIDDFAHILELAIGIIDLGAQIPSPLFTGGDPPSCSCSVFPPRFCTGFQAYAANPRYSGLSSSVELRNGGMRVSIRITNFKVDLTVRGEVLCVGATVNGNATASSVTVTSDVAIQVIGGSPRVTLSNTSVSIQDLRINIDLGFFGDIASSIVNLFAGTITGLVEASLEQMIRDNLPATLEGFLASFGLDSKLTIPAPLNSTISIFADLSSTAFTTARGKLGLGTAFTSKAGMNPAGLGSILHPSLMTPAPPSGRPIALAMSHDSLNQLLYAAWKNMPAGLDVSSQIPELDQMSIDSFEINLLLPPVLTGGGTAPLRLEFGDVHLQMAGAAEDNSPVEIEAYLSTALRAEVSAEGNRMGIEITGIDEVGVDVVSMEGISALIDLPSSGIVDALELLLPLVLAQYASEILQEFDLPSFDLGGLGIPGIPAGTSLSPDNLAITQGPTHIYITGDLTN